MIRDGAVSLSNGPNLLGGPVRHVETNPQSFKVMRLIDQADAIELQQFAKWESEALVRVIKAALDDEITAQSIVVSPTPRGFKLFD